MDVYENYKSTGDFGINRAPAPPEEFNVNSGGDRINLTWTPSPSSSVMGYRIYRGIHVPDSTYEMIQEVDANVTQYSDTSPQRGFDYYYFITAFDDGSTNDIFWGWFDASGYIGVTAGDGVGAKSLLAINDNVWRHISITRSAVDGSVAFYVNGVLNNSGTSGVGNITTVFSKFGVIPKSPSGTPADFNGKIDEIRIEASILNADQIKADFKFQNNSHISFGQLEQY